jgi:hypothetical protein
MSPFYRRISARWGIVVLVAAGVALSAQQLPSEPQRQFGTGITGSFEGWFANADGGRSFLVGYLNRNTAQELDVPIGPNNRIEPGGPDVGQPTHFCGPSMGRLQPCPEGVHDRRSAAHVDDRRQRPDDQHPVQAPSRLHREPVR